MFYVIFVENFENHKKFFQLEEVVVEMLLPKSVQNCNLIPSNGKCTFDPYTKLLQWNVGKIELGKPPTLKGSVLLISV